MRIFYSTNFDGKSFTLDDNDSRHLAKVLRLSVGDLVSVIDGSGNLYNCSVAASDTKRSIVKVISVSENYNPDRYSLHIAIAPTKNIDRFEWFVEKCVELGISRITPIICERSERKTLKTSRIERIIISAMKQSIKTKKTIVDEPVKFSEFLLAENEEKRFIAHCIPDSNNSFLNEVYSAGERATILIGPEGDFSPYEVEMAIKGGYKEINLGRSRLRTETAGVVACSMVYFINQ